MFSSEELERYNRHLLLPEIGLEGQKKLKSARILIIGMGGLGSPVSIYLSAAGVGNLGLMDEDYVDRSNLHRQILYGTENLNRSKVETAKEKLTSLNPNVNITTHSYYLNPENASRTISEYDLVVDCTDNFDSHYLVNDVCVDLSTPYVYGNISRFSGQVSTVIPHKGPCYRCLFPSLTPSMKVPSCAEAGVLGVLPGLIGMLQATEALKQILDLGDLLSGRVIYFDLLKSSFKEFHLKQNRECPTCGKSPHKTPFINTKSTLDSPSVLEITSEELRLLQETHNEFCLLDVRENWEYQQTHIPGSKLIPLNELEDRYHELSSSQLIVVYCKSGMRSVKATQYLRSKGFSHLKTLIGGLNSYRPLE